VPTWTRIDCDESVNITLQWILGDGKWLPIFDSLKDNHEFCLLLARNYNTDTHFYFTKATQALRGNVDFMRKAIKLNHRIYLTGDDVIRRDFVLASLACGAQFRNAEDLINELLKDDYKEWSSFFRTLRDDTSRKIQSWDGFSEWVAFGLSKFSGADCASSCLAALDNETLMSLKTQIASYLGLPDVEDIAWVRRANGALSKWNEDFKYRL
jgi:hypothetical protein